MFNGTISIHKTLDSWEQITTMENEITSVIPYLAWNTSIQLWSTIHWGFDSFSDLPKFRFQELQYDSVITDQTNIYNK